MLIRKVTRGQLDRALRAVNDLSGSTIQYRDIAQANKRGDAWRLTLRLESSRDIYHRRSQRPRCRCRTMGCDHEGFRMPYVCWHGHRDFMRCLYQLNPDAVILSGSIHRGGIRYNGALDFEVRHPVTGERNIGSEYHPLSFADACDCDHDYTAPVVRVTDRERQIDRAERSAPEDYGASAADGAACRAVANALRAIQRERKEGVTA